MKDRAVWAIAVHEAAHALAAHLTGTPLVAVVITDDGENVRGVCRTMGAPALVALAGSAGDVVLLERAPDRWGSGADVRLAAESLVEDGTPHLAAHYVLRARTIVHRHRDAVLALARRLYEVREMAGAEVGATLEAAGAVAGSEPPTLAAALEHNARG